MERHFQMAGPPFSNGFIKNRINPVDRPAEASVPCSVDIHLP